MNIALDKVIAEVTEVVILDHFLVLFNPCHAD